MNNGGCDARTGCTNRPGDRDCGACPPGFTGNGETGCTAHGCDGTTPNDECTCIKVAPDGDDALAAASGGLLPFHKLQTALDFAADFSGAPPEVCVAVGTTCGGSATYEEVTLHARDGISAFAGYESTTWTRCDTGSVSVQPLGKEGLYFGSNITKATVFDGFVVEPLAASPEAAITIDGAHGVRLHAVQVPATSAAYAANVSGGADATLDAFSARDNVLVREARVTLDSSDVLGELTLENAPGSLVTNNTLSNVALNGSAAGTELRGNTVNGTGRSGGPVAVGGVFVGDCAGESPLFADNSVNIWSPAGSAVGFSVNGDCAPRIDANQISLSAPWGAFMTGVDCESGAHCSITHNFIGNSAQQSTSSGGGEMTGIRCNGACTEVSHNSVLGNGSAACQFGCGGAAIGLKLTGAALVDSNRLTGGCAGSYRAGMTASAAPGEVLRIRNNTIFPGSYCSGFYPIDNGLYLEGAAEVHSNTMEGLPALWSDAGGTFRNNIMSTAFVEGTGSPEIFENNALMTYYDGVLGSLQTADAVNALGDTQASGNILADPRSWEGKLLSGSPCIDAGTTVDAPQYDQGGQLRDQKPDIGSDEYSPEEDLCFGVTCSGHGTCMVAYRGAGGNLDIFCNCEPNYRHVGSNDQTCEYDPCLVQNGGCDPHVTCSSQDGKATCGDCPPGYTGTGDTQCVPIDECVETDCGNGTCSTVDGAGLCTCPPGSGGAHCEIQPNALYAGDEHACTLSIGASEAHCWGNNDARQASAPSDNFFTLALGARHTCGIRGYFQSTWHGPIQCWGDDSAGQSSPPDGDYLQVAAGATHSCGVTSSHKVVCWGSNEEGESSVPDGDFIAVAAGNHNTCAIGFDQLVHCWGSNDQGQSTPPALKFFSIALGEAHGCGLIAGSYAVACWGANSYGQTTVPALAKGATKVLASGNHSCAATSDDRLTCWGENALGESTPPSGRFGYSTSVGIGAHFGCGIRELGTQIDCWGDDSGWQFVAPGGAVRALSGNLDHACSLNLDDTLDCWGNNGSGQTAVLSGTYRSVAVGGTFSCAIKSDGTLSCWGANFGSALTPPPGYFNTLAADGFHACAIAGSGETTCWGNVEASPPSDAFQALAVGSEHACGLLGDGSVKCWGNSAFDQTTPPPVAFKSIAAASNHTCGILTSGELACFGSTTDVGAPPPTGNDFIAVSAGYTQDCAIHAGGSVECWGAQKTDPPPVSFRSVDARSMCGIRTDNLVQCWGPRARGGI